MINYRSRTSENSIPTKISSACFVILSIIAVVATYLLQYVIFPDHRLDPLSKISDTMTCYQTDHPIKLNEIMTSNFSAYVDETGNYINWIEVINTSNEPINIEGYSLTDKLTRKKVFIFPNVTLNPSQVAIVFASGRKKNDLDKPFHAPFKLDSKNETGETIYLRDATGIIIDAVQTPFLGADQVYARNSQTLEWEVSTQYTPLLANTPVNAELVLGSKTIDNNARSMIETFSGNK